MQCFRHEQQLRKKCSRGPQPQTLQTQTTSRLKHKLRQVSNTNCVKSQTQTTSSLKHKLRQKFQTQTTSSLKHKLRRLKHKLRQVSNTNYVKSLKHKLRQKSQAQTKGLTLYTEAEQLTGCKVHYVE